MKKNNSLWYVVGIMASMAGVAGALAYRKKKVKSQAKDQIIRSLLVGRHWYVSRMKLLSYSSIKQSDLLLFVENGVLLDLGKKESFRPEQREYINIGNWTLYGNTLEAKWTGPTDYTSYKWSISIVSSDKLRLKSLVSGNIIEITAIDNDD